jgi:hypothetical protein
LFEEQKNQKFAKNNAALKAKLAFIEEKYDQSSAVKKLSLEDFRALVDSNNSVNTAVDGFTGKLNDVQKEVQSLEALKEMNM